MSITAETDMIGMQAVSKAVALTLRAMQSYAKPGMSTKELDDFGARMLYSFGAKSAPYSTYKFPGCTCICVNHEVAHGIPSASKILKDGDLVNVDVSAEMNGFWADNGGSFVLGQDIHNHNSLVEASKQILKKAISNIKGGVRIKDVGYIIEKEADKRGYKVIHNLTGHGIGKKLHEEPSIPNYRDQMNFSRFRKNSVVAVETFIATHSTLAVLDNPKLDEWTLVGNKGGYVAQHEHTIVVTDGAPVILTEANGIWNL
ncbi:MULTISPECIES: type I methionyl aminopeptidase [Bacteroidota]|uniref:Methionine aminopeptidase n=2 Tax=Sphingobacterium TaxID=28453 RepID=A0A1X7J7A8_9SPHI|nr:MULTISPECIES: type I methionyl aminopeptidase [Bacteroidota]EHM7981310.1 type I methionyl aminopeptidase [Elizabethkingia anophelis]EHM8032913.1 type I methionyl aminopeptidase [Elizabethkingia anophelis]EHM8034256.1 type I methionyl aminopeptidase [Elizabethkingia anophelis]EHZ9535920.1 type I methionyl aminopeptidase [Elizabethkingia anophelis]EKU3673829.1 type I methionyl aminopeptidase [Elizabethkingia anophelis]